MCVCDEASWLVQEESITAAAVSMARDSMRVKALPAWLYPRSAEDYGWRSAPLLLHARSSMPLAFP